MVQSIDAARPKPDKPTTRVAAEHRYPAYNLEDCLEVALVIHERGGGSATRDQVASFLNYSTTNSGAFLSRVAAPRLFGLVESSGRQQLAPTRLAMQILYPERPEDAVAARVEAFLTVPLYRELYKRYEGKQLPSEAGVRNVLAMEYAVPVPRTGVVYRVLMESAEQAGFFATRGTPTHLVMPVASRGSYAAAGEQNEQESADRGSGSGGGGNGGDGGNRTPPPLLPTDREQVRLEYVRKLISLLGTEGTEQAPLMERIERLLAETEDKDT